MRLDSHYIRSQRQRNDFDATLIAGLANALDCDPAVLRDRTDFAVDTDGGTLRGTLYLCNHIDSEWNGGRGFWSPGWVHFRFDDVNAAKEVVAFGNLNPYSAKWNFMFSGKGGHLTLAADVGYMVHAIKHIQPRNFRLI